MPAISLLFTIEGVLRNGLSNILNTKLNDSQWKQASLPVQMGGLGMRSACTLAPSSFFVAAAATLSLQNAILPESLHDTEDLMVSFALASWKSLMHKDEPIDEIQYIQRAWDTPVAHSAYEDLLTSCDTLADKARLKAAEAPHAGDLVKCATTNSDWPMFV